MQVVTDASEKGHPRGAHSQLLGTSNRPPSSFVSLSGGQRLLKSAPEHEGKAVWGLSRNPLREDFRFDVFLELGD